MIIATIALLAACINLPSTCASCARDVEAPCTHFGLDNNCLGVELSYHQTFVHAELREGISKWSFLQAFPRCWDKVQPLLCAVYKPVCNNSMVDLYSSKLCSEARDTCQILKEINGDWPEFLQCDSPYFSKKENCPVCIRHPMHCSIL